MCLLRWGPAEIFWKIEQRSGDYLILSRCRIIFFSMDLDLWGSHLKVMPFERIKILEFGRVMRLLRWGPAEIFGIIEQRFGDCLTFSVKKHPDPKLGQKSTPRHLYFFDRPFTILPAQPMNGVPALPYLLTRSSKCFPVGTQLGSCLRSPPSMREAARAGLLRCVPAVVLRLAGVGGSVVLDICQLNRVAHAEGGCLEGGTNRPEIVC